MQRLLLTLLAATLLATGSASAQVTSSATKPYCSAGDPVVWVNTKSGVYHAQGDRYYGNTKQGTYLCKSAADAKQYHAASTHGNMGSSSTRSGATTPMMAATPAAMASPMSHSRHHHSTQGAMPMATMGSDSAMPEASAMPSGKHHRHKHGQTMPGMASPMPGMSSPMP